LTRLRIDPDQQDRALTAAMHCVDDAARLEACYPILSDPTASAALIECRLLIRRSCSTDPRSDRKGLDRRGPGTIPGTLVLKAEVLDAIARSRE
jgi:hypothetical protein